ENFSWSRLKELIVFGSKSFIQGIATRVENATDVLVIGFIMGPAMVPFYSIPANLTQHIRGLGWTLTHAFMPLFSGLSAKAEDEMIRRDRKSTRLNSSHVKISYAVFCLKKKK